jgi:NAD(P)-dependent dehydrogenase (short-subunit alcohol dehydrogenase family)
MDEDLKKMTCVVTGATSGIGFEAAAQLASRGAIVLGIGRDIERCAAAEKRIRAATGSSRVTLLTADLSSQVQVRRLAGEISAGCEKVDVLVNNAGAFTLTRQETVDGLETQLAVNWLAGFMLTGLLMPLILEAPCPRVVTVSSGSHFAGTMHWADLGLRRGYHGLKAYDQSKLAGVLFTYELARRYRGTRGFAAHAVDPGLVKTQIAAKGNNGLVKLVWKIRTRKGINPGRAAQSVVWCATDPDAGEKSGLYWKECRSLPSSPESYDPQAAARLWEAGETLSGVRYPVCCL